jgi:hypothetical protein
MRETEILQQTLQTTREQAVFDRLRMYYLGRFIVGRCAQQALRMKSPKGEITTLALYKNPAAAIEESVQSVDGIMGTFSRNLSAFSKELDEYTSKRGYGITHERNGNKLRREFLEKLTYVATEAEQLVTAPMYRDDPLIGARLKGICFQKLLENTTALQAQLGA